MGFLVMILSFVVGVILIALGFSYKKKQRYKILNVISILIGIGLIILAIWLGLPK